MAWWRCSGPWSGRGAAPRVFSSHPVTGFSSRLDGDSRSVSPSTSWAVSPAPTSTRRSRWEWRFASSCRGTRFPAIGRRRCFGAALVFPVFNNAINHFDQMTHAVKGQPSSLATYSTFATFPAPYYHNLLGPLISEIVGTFFLALFVFAVTDEYNAPPGVNLTPVVVGFIVLAIGISFGANTGWWMNPA